MGMDRWDPFREMMTFREAMDRWLQQGISGTGQLLANMRSETIPIDVVESDDAFEVRAVVPGVKPEDVEVTVQGERVTVRAESREQEEKRGENWLIREQRQGTMQRSITLPSAVSSENAQARIEHGVLTLRLPKAAGALPHRINVLTGALSPSAKPPGAARGGDSRLGEGDQSAAGKGDRVTEQSEESFPASDPPSWTSEKA
jgi:HSP20 family protein